MPLLSRANAAPLLRQVRGHSHATDDDHVEQLPTPPATDRSTATGGRGAKARAMNIHARSTTLDGGEGEQEEDITRSPVSSDDENLSSAVPEAAAARPSCPTFHTPQSLGPTGATNTESPRRLSAFRQPPPIISSPPSTQSKRSNEELSGASQENGVDDDLDDDDAGVFGAAERRKRQKSAYGGSSSSSFSNIHAPPKRKERQYGGKSGSQKTVLDKGKGTSTSGPAKFFKKLPPGIRREDGARERREAVPLPQFKMAVGADVFEFRGRGEEDSKRGSRFHAAIASSDSVTHGTIDDGRRNSLSPSLSPALPPSSPEIHEISTLDIYSSSGANDHNDNDADTFTCPICDETMPASLRRTFFHSIFAHRDADAEAMLNYKWQQRFCRWHRGEEAKRVRARSGYPEIDWEALSSRMRRFHGHLKLVLRGKTPSIYRDRLAERVRDRSKTAVSVFGAGGDGDGRDGTTGKGTGTSAVGYYGPKGERVMTEHIIANLSDEIRKQSTKDRLVAAVGVSGGVSGFVQAVLVPELAEQLVCEDMNVSSARAREIMVSGAELGELLYPDANDRVEERMDED